MVYSSWLSLQQWKNFPLLSTPWNLLVIFYLYIVFPDTRQQQLEIEIEIETKRLQQKKKKQSIVQILSSSTKKDQENKRYVITERPATNFLKFVWQTIFFPTNENPS